MRELDIKVVGIADHGSVDELDKLRDVLSGKGLVVFPGFAIASTEKVHMVCLFPESTTRDQLKQYLGELGLAGTQDGRHPSKYSCLEVAQRTFDLGGFWYAAHVTGANGLLRLGSKDEGALTHSWTDSKLGRAAQIAGPIAGLTDNYRQIVDNKNTNYDRDRAITVINAKDVAKPEDLRDATASSWIKMTEPTFEAFKVAFPDPVSRVRLSLAETPHHGFRGLFGELRQLGHERGDVESS